MPLSSLNAPVSGMRTAQRNLAVTAHNISNLNTPGFSRQRVNQVDHFSRSLGSNATTLLQAGLGTDIVSIQQLRDGFLDTSFRNQVGRSHFYGTIHQNGSQIESMMRELLPGGTGTSTISSTRNIWASLQELTTNPHAIDHRVNFISSITTYIDQMNMTFSRMRNQQQALNTEVINTVDRLNELVRTVDRLNHKITSIEVTGQAANDFRDERSLALDEIASIIDVSITFSHRGAAEISTNGVSLLSSNHITYVGLRFTGDGTNLVEPVVGDEVVRGARPLAFDPTFRNARSILRFDRPPKNYESPGLLLGLVTSRGLGEAHHASHILENPHAAGAIPPLDAYALFQWEARRDFNSHIAIIPRTMRHLDTSFNHLTTMINEFLTNREASTDPSTWGFWNDETADLDNATANLITDPNRNMNGIPIFVTRDPELISDAPISANPYTINYTLGNVIINPYLLMPGGYNYLGFHVDSLNIDDTQILQNLLYGWQYTNVSLDGSQEMNVEDLLNYIVIFLATEIKAFEDASFNQDHRLRNIDTARTRIFGVSLEEELSNMMIFQHSFNASARLINVIDSMIDTVVNRMLR